MIQKEVIAKSTCCVPGEKETSAEMFVYWDLWVVQDSKTTFSDQNTRSLSPFCKKDG